MLQLCLVVFLTLGCFTYLASRTPMSKIYKNYHPQTQILEHANNLNSHRLEKAQRYFDKVQANRSIEGIASLPMIPHDPALVVCIISARRASVNSARPGYLIQTAAVMDQLIKRDTHFPRTVFFVCNVDKQPTGNGDAVELQTFIHFVRKHGENSLNRTFKRFDNFVSKNHVQSRGKETEDYIFCLNVSHSFGAPYILMLEDDVLPYKNVFHVLDFTLSSRNLRPFGRKFSFVKLHYPERWQGFAFEIDRLLELISISAIGGAIVYSILVPCSRHHISNSVKSFYMIFGSLATMLCVSLIGRQFLMDMRRMHPQLFKFAPAAHCCTPAMLYNNDVIPQLIPYLMDHSQKNKDLAVYDFTEEASLPGYQIEPNLFRHIGLYTSLGDGHKPPEEFLFDLDV